MKIVQEALRKTGIYAVEQIYAPTEDNMTAPQEYIVYTVASVLDDFYDDAPHEYRRLVYMTYWTKTDPTNGMAKIRRAMWDAGFTMVEETDQGYNQSRYDYNTSLYSVRYTWVLYVPADDYEVNADGV